MVDALKRASAKRITVVAPFYPYARQDKKHRGREPISARLVADLFKTAGANRLMSVDLHAAQIQGFFDGPVDHLWALPVLVGLHRGQVRDGGDDRGLARRRSGPAGRHVERPAELRGWPSSTSGATPTWPTRSSVHEVVGDVAGPGLPAGRRHDRHRRAPSARPPRRCRSRGAKAVIAAATHAVLSGPAVDRLKATAFEEVIVTNTLPIRQRAAASTA